MNKVETYNRKNILSQIKWLIKIVRYLLKKESSGGGIEDMPDVSATERGVVNNEPLQELGGADKLINDVRIGKGNGNNGSNLVLGNASLGSNTTGANNIAIGRQVLNDNTTGDNNIAFGNFSLRNNTTGAHNTAVGTFALFSNTTGQWNSAIGESCMAYNTTGHRNVAIGTSLYWNSTGSFNTGLGFNAGLGNTTGNRNTYIGYKAGFDNGVGNYNIAIGADAMIITGAEGSNGSTLDMNNNVFIGARLRLTDGVDNTLAIDNKGNTMTDYQNALLYGNFADRFLRINGRFEIDPATMPTADIDFTKKLVYNPTDGKVTAVDDTSGGGIQSIVAGDNITVDNTDPQNPIISSTGGDSNLTLEQARQNGNVLEGDVVIENFSSGQNETGFISEGGSSKITFTNEDGVLINKLQANTNSFINVYSNYALLGINDYALGNQISIEASYINNEPSILISTSGKEETKGLIGSKEFNKQGDRKAYVQMGDIEDFYKTIPGYDEGTTQILKHVNGVLQWVIDK